MVMTDWMRSVQAALKTIPKNTPNRLGAAMKKAKLTYKKKGSSAAASSSEIGISSTGISSAGISSAPNSSSSSPPIPTVKSYSFPPTLADK